MIIKHLATLTLALLCLCGCRKEELQQAIPSTWTKVAEADPHAEIKGFFLLNEGNMGSNKATLDYFDYTTGYYMKNIFAERNPGVVKELGDVGNDLQIYGNKLYAVINCSHFVEVMDVNTAQHLALISIPNCRYIVFHNGYAYVSSYAGPVQIDPNARLGYVAKVDTTNFTVVDTCMVGYQPEEMVVADGKLYVANSGGYRVPNYDNTVSVIDLNTFTQTKKVEVAINLHRLEKGANGNIYISSRGDYYGTPSRTLMLDPSTDQVTEPFGPLPCSNMTLVNDMLYLSGTEWSYQTGSNTISFAKADTQSQTLLTRNFITDNTLNNIKVPYGIAVNPQSGQLFVTDAKDYVTPGTLYCFNKEGQKLWSVTTGDIPAHIVFTRKQLLPIQ